MVGCIHNFIAAPMSFSTLSTTALWFITGGLSLWYAGAINIVHASAATPSRILNWATRLINTTMLAFVIAFAVVNGSWKLPEGILLVATVFVALASSLHVRHRVMPR